eukprot:CAMPEP_0197072912 /NCGR_PEP_ID=MMETSP1384-20130603/210337_1 /TAXON_ID=29189 /ORGANISM="Ammonia sp." /LENGTH=420 /DNA_ID=CAMNT_0042511735 /DNA_START=44 /DNA_END=1306 /DNA_ORIENTATION=-
MADLAGNLSTAPISVSNLVNLSNLERVFTDIYDKLSTFSSRLDQLESGLASNVSLTRFLSLKNEYESNMNLMENRLKYLEESASEFKPIIAKCTYNQESIEKLRENAKSLVSTQSFESSLNDLQSSVNEQLDQMNNSKSNNERCKKLEESAKNLSQQMSAMESMLQCKVDKSQVPLIESCQKQLDSLERFRDQISQRVCIIDDQIADINTDLDAKLNQTTFDDAQIEIEKILLKKVDMAFLNEQVIKRLNTLLPDLLVLLKEHKQVTASQCWNELQCMQSQMKQVLDRLDVNKSNIESILEHKQVTASQCWNELQCMQSQMKQVLDRLDVNKSNIESILKSLYNIPSVQQMEIKADKEYCHNLSRECKQFCKSECERLEANMKSASTEINKLKTISNSLTDKMKVALRFIDWYSTLQLES